MKLAVVVFSKLMTIFPDKSCPMVKHHHDNLAMLNTVNRFNNN